MRMTGAHERTKRVMPGDRPSSHDRIGSVIAGRYTIERLLGHGGMGEVYVAMQAPLQRRIALKLIRSDMADQALSWARFEREAKALAQLSDPHIVTIHDFGVTKDDELFMAMELLDGQSLRERMGDVGAMEPTTALQIVRQLSAGLEAAHRSGIVHRDLKPDNVMLMRISAGSITGGSSNDFVKILDFGVAIRFSRRRRPLTWSCSTRAMCRAVWGTCALSLEQASPFVANCSSLSRIS